MVLTDPQAIRLADAINDVENKRRRLKEAIEAIREHKRKNKALYRAYYLADEDLRSEVAKHKEDKLTYDCVKHFQEVDTSDIFYKTSKMRVLGDPTIAEP